MPPAIIAAGIGAAASVGGGLMASSAAKKASKAQVQASQDAKNCRSTGLETHRTDFINVVRHHINRGSNPWTSQGILFSVNIAR